ncbi:MAG: cytochrome c biogenesis protein CcsA [Bryobacteraceae bacterium]
MHEMSTVWLRFAVVLYSLGLLHAILAILRKRSQLFRPALIAFLIAAVLHLVALVEESVYKGRLPVSNFWESVSFCAFLLALLYLIICYRRGFESLGVFVFPLVFLMALLGSFDRPVGPWANPAVRDVWLLVHVVLVLCGYVSLVLTAAASVVYLIQERQLKKKTLRVLAGRLPALGTLDEFISGAMAIGFVLITLAVIAGSTWAFIESGIRWIREPKIVISLVTWAFYLVMVYLRIGAGWRGRKAAFMALALVGCSALTWASHAGLRSLLKQG